MINSLEIISCRFHYFVVILYIYLYVCCLFFFTRANLLAQSAHIVCINCVASILFIFFLLRWISMRWTIFFSSNICIELSLQVTFTLHIISSIHFILLFNSERFIHIMTKVQIDSMTESSVKFLRLQSSI